MNSSADGKPAFVMPVAGLLTWLLPGAGHIYIGDRVRGAILLITIAVTFWMGVAIGGVKNTVNPNERSLWFLAQVCAGGHTLTTLALSRQIPDPPLDKKATRVGFGSTEEVSVVYTAICGLLNVLIIFDVLVRAERRAAAPAAVEARPPGRRASP